MNVFQLWFAKEWRALCDDPKLDFGANEHESRAAFVVWRETRQELDFGTWMMNFWSIELMACELPEDVWGTGPWSWDRRAAWLAYEAMWAAGKMTPQPTEEQLALF